MIERQNVSPELLSYIQRLRLIDDDFMCKCFEDLSCTQFVLSILLEREDLIVESVHTQHQIKNLQGRSVILDIYAIDQQGKHYNIEIQRSDRGAGTKRARYHSSILDANMLLRGTSYDQLSETYVIFLTERDVLKRGLPIYHIDRVIRETSEIFDDQAHILYVNASYQDDSPLGLLMQDFTCQDPNEMHYSTLARRARYFKEDVEGVNTMCKLLEEMCDRVAEQVRAESTIETARRMLAMEKFSCEDIALATGLTLEDILALRHTPSDSTT